MSVETKLKRKVVFWSPGSFFSEDYHYDVPDDVTDVVEWAIGNAPQYAFCFEVEELITVDPIVDRAGNKFKVEPKLASKSGRYYLGGTVMTKDDVAALPGDNRILLSNMNNDGWGVMIRTPFGNFQPFMSEDKVVQPKA